MNERNDEKRLNIDIAISTEIKIARIGWIIINVGFLLIIKIMYIIIVQKIIRLKILLCK